MPATSRILVLMMVGIISPQWILAQQTKEITIKEPGKYKLAGLYKVADTVALVKVVSGDTENYDCAVYQA